MTAAGSSILNRAVFEKLTTDGLIAFLASKEITLDANEQAIFRKQKIDGASLAVLSFDNLKAEGIPSGVAARMLDLVPRQQLKRASSSQWPLVWLSAGVALAAVLVWLLLSF